MVVNSDLTKRIDEVKYLSVENTERYRPIIRYFFKQYEKLEYWLYKEDVYSNLKDNFDSYTIDLCEQDLLRLVEWGNLTNIQDTTNVKTVEEFKNRKFRYQLTEYAIEIERMVMHLETLKVETSSLEPKLFDKLRVLLSEFNNLENKEDISDHFEELNETFTKLNNNYKDFLKMFHEAKSEELMKSESFLIYKDKVIEYLKNFITGFQINEIKIQNILNNLPSDFEDKMIAKVMEHKKNQPIIEPDFDFLYLEEVLRGKWQSIVKWFLCDNFTESESERLKKAVNNIINKITKYVISIIETNTSINRMEEYKHILNLFFQSDSLEDCAKLATATFGIEKVKHISNVEKTTDSINTSPKDVVPTFITLKSHSRLVREKSVKNQVDYKYFEKEEQLKKILEEKEREEKLLKEYIKKGEIVIKDLNNIEKFERRFILSLITKGINKDIVKNNEYGVSYKVESIDDDDIHLVSLDGILTMKNFKITFMGDKNGI